MPNLKRFNNQSGFSMLETIIGISIALTLTGICGAMLIDIFSRQGKIASLAAGGIAEMQTVQAIHSPKVLRKLLNLRHSPDIEKCLQQSGTRCTRFSSNRPVMANLSNANLDRFSGSGGNCTALSEKCPFDQEVLYRWKCSSTNACDGVEVLVRTKRYQFEQGRTQNATLSTVNEHKFYVKASDLSLAPIVDYGTCAGKILIGIDPSTKQAICRDNRQQLSCNGFSVVGVGSGNCGTAPPRNDTHLCTLNLTTTASGLTLQYSATGPGATRFAFRCMRSGSTVGDVSNIRYFRNLESVGGVNTFPLNSGNVQVNCTADLRGEGIAPLASCSASYSFTAPGGPSESGGTGSGSGSSNRNRIPAGSGTSTSSSSGVSAKTSGNGASITSSVTQSGTSAR